MVHEIGRIAWGNDIVVSFDYETHNESDIKLSCHSPKLRQNRQIGIAWTLFVPVRLADIETLW